MPLLQLNNIGKIYVSEGNVSVGIREINLSFDKGEFACVTGKSGAGKTTLLNVISGMDSYEEGELYVNGSPTSHFLQLDWEEYRKEYISFIFQDYNIIESFTVLENVELALMHIEDRKERRRRAIELIDRVGLTRQQRQKGSRLSGGQKQRTVIARALAKDSPIILADEPTGNLDSQTSKEIIELLRQVSQDKLVIVVTHNFDDFAHCATRHIRIHDGFVEQDQIISENLTEPREEEEKISEKAECDEKKKNPILSTILDGLSLGFSIFKSKPRLTMFLCILMIIGTLGIFGVTAMCGSADDLFKPFYMFTEIDGRLILTAQSGEPITEEEIAKLATKYGAEDYLRFDSLLDLSRETPVLIPSSDEAGGYMYLYASSTYIGDFGSDILGRYPEEKNEVFLSLPITYSTEFGREKLILDQITINDMLYTVSGVKYYYDNNIPPVCLFTKEGFRVATAAHFLNQCSVGGSITISRPGLGKNDEYLSLFDILPSFDIPEEKIYLESGRYSTILSTETEFDTIIDLSLVFTSFSIMDFSSDTASLQRIFTKSDIISEKPTIGESAYGYDTLVISDELLLQMADEMLSQCYSQASLFFTDTDRAHQVAELIRADGYVGVPSDTTYVPGPTEAILIIIESIATAIVWILSIIFLAFFINLCSLRAILAFKGDVAIMRSMGISVGRIRVGVFARMAFCLIPAFALLIFSAVGIYTSPKLNGLFTYLYPWQYLLILLGMIILTLRTTAKQVSGLFGESVKTSLRGGNE